LFIFLESYSPLGCIPVATLGLTRLKPWLSLVASLNLVSRDAATDSVTLFFP